MATTPLLIVGAPRSGTTLLTAMIGRHSAAAMLNENYERALDDVLSKPVVGNKLCIPNHIELETKKPRWVRFFGSWLHHALYRRGYFRYRPEASLSIQDYLTFYPNLKLIGIIRDGNAVVSSIMRRGQQPQAVAEHRWRRSIEILTQLADTQSERLFLLSFDQLVTKPDATMRTVADFLDLPFEPGMLEGYASTPNYSNAKIDPNKATRRTNTDLDLEAKYPRTYEQFETLRAHCRTRIPSA